MITSDIIDIETLVLEEEETFTLTKDFIDQVKVLGLMEIEPLLEEDVKIVGRLEKYEFLALLRDLFNEFKKLGDTRILVSEGTCGICGAYKVNTPYSSIRGIRKVLQLKGNNSGEAAYFAIQSKENESLMFKFCNGFIDKDGSKNEHFSHTTKLTDFVRERQAQLSGYRKS